MVIFNNNNVALGTVGNVLASIRQICCIYTSRKPATKHAQFIKAQTQLKTGARTRSLQMLLHWIINVKWPTANNHFSGNWFSVFQLCESHKYNLINYTSYCNNEGQSETLKNYAPVYVNTVHYLHIFLLSEWNVIKIKISQCVRFLHTYGCEHNKKLV